MGSETVDIWMQNKTISLRSKEAEVSKVWLVKAAFTYSLLQLDHLSRTDAKAADVNAMPVHTDIVSDEIRANKMSPKGTG